MLQRPHLELTFKVQILGKLLDASWLSTLTTCWSLPGTPRPKETRKFHVYRHTQILLSPVRLSSVTGPRAMPCCLLPKSLPKLPTLPTRDHPKCSSFGDLFGAVCSWRCLGPPFSTKNFDQNWAMSLQRLGPWLFRVYFWGMKSGPQLCGDYFINY